MLTFLCCLLPLAIQQFDYAQESMSFQPLTKCVVRMSIAHWIEYEQNTAERRDLLADSRDQLNRMALLTFAHHTCVYGTGILDCVHLYSDLYLYDWPWQLQGHLLGDTTSLVLSYVAALAFLIALPLCFGIIVHIWTSWCTNCCSLVDWWLFDCTASSCWEVKQVSLDILVLYCRCLWLSLWMLHASPSR